MLVGNKSDATDNGGERQVPTAEGKAFAESKDIPFLETSAKNGTFVDTAFLMMAHDIKTLRASNGNSGYNSNGYTFYGDIAIESSEIGYQTVIDNGLVCPGIPGMLVLYRKKNKN